MQPKQRNKAGFLTIDVYVQISVINAIETQPIETIKIVR